MVVANKPALLTYLATRLILLNRLNILNILNSLGSLVPHAINDYIFLITLLWPIALAAAAFLLFMIGLAVIAFLGYSCKFLIYLDQHFIKSCQDIFANAKDYFKVKRRREKDKENAIGIEMTSYSP